MMNRNRDNLPDDFYQSSPDFGADITLGLEVVMVRSALAHQYALLDLDESNQDYFLVEEIKNQIEVNKEEYFKAREKLLEINPEKLSVIEGKVKLHRENLFGSLPKYLH